MEKQSRTGALSPDETRKKLKKYARREARAMQTLEQARRDLKKAEQKLTRATRNLQEQQTYLQVCEHTLAEVRSARRAVQEARGEAPSETANRELALAEADQQRAEKTSAATGPTDDEGIVTAVEEALSALADVEAAVAKVMNETSQEQKSLPEQPAFDANETITIDEFTIEEIVANDEFSQPDENVTPDLAGPGAEQSRATDTRAPEKDGDAPDPESPQQSTRKATARRPRATTAATSQPATTRRRSPSNRARSNEAEKASNEGKE